MMTFDEAVQQYNFVHERLLSERELSLASVMWGEATDAQREPLACGHPRACLCGESNDPDAQPTMWCSACEEIAKARAAERERCLNIAVNLQCEEPPADYMASHLFPVRDWERAQCWHGDQIAAAIKEADDDE